MKLRFSKALPHPRQGHSVLDILRLKGICLTYPGGSFSRNPELFNAGPGRWFTRGHEDTLSQSPAFLCSWRMARPGPRPSLFPVHCLPVWPEAAAAQSLGPVGMCAAAGLPGLRGAAWFRGPLHPAPGLPLGPGLPTTTTGWSGVKRLRGLGGDSENVPWPPGHLAHPSAQGALRTP